MLRDSMIGATNGYKMECRNGRDVGSRVNRFTHPTTYESRREE